MPEFYNTRNQNARFNIDETCTMDSPDRNEQRHLSCVVECDRYRDVRIAVRLDEPVYTSARKIEKYYKDKTYRVLVMAITESCNKNVYELHEILSDNFVESIRKGIV